MKGETFQLAVPFIQSLPTINARWMITIGCDGSPNDEP
jgi:hypothetical protein